MNLEAVTVLICNATANSDDKKVAFVIRQSNQASGTSSHNRQPAPQSYTVRGHYRQGQPITVSNGNQAPKLLVPANVRLAVSGDTISTSQQGIPGSWNTTSGQLRLFNNFASPTPNINSPCSSQNRSISVCSSSSPHHPDMSPMSPTSVSYAHNMPGTSYRLQQSDSRSIGSSNGTQTWPTSGASSTTPDSGIQSVPGSPPCGTQPLTPPTMEAATECEEANDDDDDDFADMPRLIPMNQHEEQQFPGPSSVREDTSSAHGSECETASAPTLSINPGMDSQEIVKQLLQFDPEKASAIAKLIRKKTQEQKRRSDSRQDPSPTAKRFRPGSSASDELRKSEEEVKGKDSPRTLPADSPRTLAEPSPVPSPQPTMDEQPNKKSPKDSESEAMIQYRLCVRRRMQQKLASIIEKTQTELQDLHIGHRERHDRKSSTKNLFAVDWEAVKKRRKEELRRKREKDRKEKKKDVVVKEEVEEMEKEETIVHKERKRRSGASAERTEAKDSRTSRASIRTPSKRRTSESVVVVEEIPEKKREMDYAEISRSFCASTSVEWSCPKVQCGCTRGACTSDAECINRALYVQCNNDCQTTLCVNKKFWKEDLVRQLSASGPKSKRVLRTRMSRRAGEFLGEFAGEVITYAEAVRRHAEAKDEPARLLCLSPSLFVDATTRGNICRYVRHSCTPNSRLEVWSIKGQLRAGLFSLIDVASGSELTIDMNGLLPVGRPCHCNTNECTKIIKPSRNAVLSSAEPLPSTEETIVKNTRVFLMRTRRKTISMASRRFIATSSTVPDEPADCFQRVLDGLQIRIRDVDGSLPYAAVRGFSLMNKTVNHIRSAKIADDKALESFNLAAEQWLEVVDDDDYNRAYSALTSHYLSHLTPSQDNKTEKKKDGRQLKREMDLSYLEAGVKVNSYNPDAAWPSGKAKEGDDAVRCECGSLEEDGEMLQCDCCHFWLHSDCIGNVDQDTDYQCKFCTGLITGAPSTDVPLAKQPEIKLDGCRYYKALNNRRGIQVRLNETVYVEKTTGDEHKKILKRLMENSEKAKKKRDAESPKKTIFPPPLPVKLPKGDYGRTDLRVFRVERAFVAPSGHRFVFGFYYARPHETICDSNRIFHRNEVFATPFYDTLPLDSVVGRCVVLDPDVWCKGRPTVPLFKEDDVFVCEFQIDRNQRSFEKIPARHRFPMNTQPYVFASFEKPVTLQRDFTPFLVNDRSASRTSGRGSRSDEHAREMLNRTIASSRIDAILQKLAPPTKTKPTTERPRKNINR